MFKKIKEKKHINKGKMFEKNNYCSYFKRGAMFGLDARIALAIFGALSVISGASLYSAIQDAKITARIVEMEEVGKAAEQYLLDIGSELPITAYHALKAGLLVQNVDNIKGWKGPYIPLKFENDESFRGLDHYFLSRCDTTGFGGQSSTGCPECTSKQNCGIWIKLIMKDTALVNALDVATDGEVDYTAGDFRVNTTTYSGDYKYRAFYHLRPVAYYTPAP